MRQIRLICDEECIQFTFRPLRNEDTEQFEDREDETIALGIAQYLSDEVEYIVFSVAVHVFGLRIRNFVFIEFVNHKDGLILIEEHQQIEQLQEIFVEPVKHEHFRVRRNTMARIGSGLIER